MSANNLNPAKAFPSPGGWMLPHVLAIRQGGMETVVDIERNTVESHRSHSRASKQSVYFFPL